LTLSALDPGKQGLKQNPDALRSGTQTLSALDPGKQGLKLHSSLLSPWLNNLSALDPGKQGLKLVLCVSIRSLQAAFSA